MKNPLRTLLIVTGLSLWFVMIMYTLFMSAALFNVRAEEPFLVYGYIAVFAAFAFGMVWLIRRTHYFETLLNQR